MQSNMVDVSLHPEMFSRRAKSIEKNICKWKTPPSNYPEGYDTCINPKLVESNQRIINHLLAAVHQALIIFFYRQVHDTSPLILQPNVEKTIEQLTKIQEEDSANGGYTSGIVWPGFIAACEALEPCLQERFSLWFDVSTKNSGISTFETAKKAAYAVWSHRRETGDDDVSWRTILRKQSLSVLCT
jgi:arginine metabolism regulation protein II